MCPPPTLPTVRRGILRIWNLEEAIGNPIFRMRRISAILGLTLPFYSWGVWGSAWGWMPCVDQSTGVRTLGGLTRKLGAWVMLRFPGRRGAFLEKKRWCWEGLSKLPRLRSLPQYPVSASALKLPGCPLPCLPSSQESTCSPSAGTTVVFVGSSANRQDARRWPGHPTDHLHEWTVGSDSSSALSHSVSPPHSRLQLFLGRKQISVCQWVCQDTSWFVAHPPRCKALKIADWL